MKNTMNCGGAVNRGGAVRSSPYELDLQQGENSGEEGGGGRTVAAAGDVRRGATVACPVAMAAACVRASSFELLGVRRWRR